MQHVHLVNVINRLVLYSLTDHTTTLDSADIRRGGSSSVLPDSVSRALGNSGHDLSDDSHAKSRLGGCWEGDGDNWQSGRALEDSGDASQSGDLGDDRSKRDGGCLRREGRCDGGVIVSVEVGDGRRGGVQATLVEAGGCETLLAGGDAGCAVGWDTADHWAVAARWRSGGGRRRGGREGGGEGAWEESWGPGEEWIPEGLGGEGAGLGDGARENDWADGEDG